MRSRSFAEIDVINSIKTATLARNSSTRKVFLFDRPEENHLTASNHSNDHISFAHSPPKNKHNAHHGDL